MSEILFEFVKQGNAIRVTAIDSATMTEAVTIAPLNMSKEQMQQLALEKLNYVLCAKNNKDCG